MRVAAVILAAGCSSRMGQPKQLMPYDGTALLRHALRAGLLAGCFPVYVVLGSERERISREIADLPACVVENAGWREGIGGSIRCGVEAIRASADSESSLLLMLADQPLVTQGQLRQLIGAAETGTHRIVAAKYAGTAGVPALFARSMFPALLGLRSSEGARNVIRDPRYSTFLVSMPEAESDIDTPEDYLRATERVHQEREVVANGR